MYIFESTFSQGRIGTFSCLPTVIYLEMSHSQTGCFPYLLHTEALIHLGILAAVAPSVHHDHLIPDGKMSPKLLLIRPQGLQR